VKLGDRATEKKKAKSSQVTFIFYSFFTIHIDLKQLYSDQHENNNSVMQTEFNSAVK